MASRRRNRVKHSEHLSQQIVACDVCSTFYLKGEKYICPKCYESSGGKRRKGW